MTRRLIAAALIALGTTAATVAPAAAVVLWNG